MGDALIGHTGFVGGYLARQFSFEEAFHSKDIDSIRGKSFDTVYCAGVSAVKWQANQRPKEDLLGIAPLLAALEGVRARRFVLISTVDVYADPLGVDEASPVPLVSLHPYGLHRRLLELFVAGRFQDSYIVRLPGLFGEGLKKNAIYDLLNRHRLEYLHPESRFQFYPLKWLFRHLQILMERGVRLAHLATPPLSVGKLARDAFGLDLPEPAPGVSTVSYDMRTRHADLFGEKGPYVCSVESLLGELRDFVRDQAGKKP